ncbi:MAG: translation initiation factor IF-2 [Clostridia bacterium]|nr:translation initiation factor IF-2 [Clostridia bacterium]
MAKQSFLETARGLKKDLNALLEQVSTAQQAIQGTMGDVKNLEKSLREKETAAKKEQQERERQERLKSLFDADDNGVVHAGGFEEAEPAPKQEETKEAPKPEPEAKPVVKEEPAPVRETSKAEEPVKEEPKAEKAPEPVAEKAPVTNDGYKATAIVNDRRNDRPQGNRFERNDRPNSGNRFGDRNGQQGAPRNDRPNGNNRFGDRPANNGRPGDRNGQQGGFNRPQNGPRPQQGGPRPAGGGFNRNAGVAAPAAPAVGGKDRGFDANKKSPAKNYDQDKKGKNKKAIQREAGPDARSWDEDSPTGSRRPKRGGKQQQMQKPEPVVIEKVVITTDTITVKDLSEKIGKPVTEIIKKLFMLGIMATINQEIDFDTCELICSEFNITAEQKLAKSFEDVLADAAEGTDAPEHLVTRPPVVTIMGHVDHGKTSLLDAIRNSAVTAGEAGGITQHIGAYTVECNNRPITFIDTPGHEAFTSMRARGAQVTDIVILVVAADDGIMPQTVEAINHAKAAGVPIIVAINKMDKPTANPDHVMQQLTEYELVPEDWGGETICVPVSAKTQMGLDSLLEMVLLQADMLELKANPKRLAKGTIIEAKLDKGRGPVATVLVQNGTLRKGDTIVAGIAYGKIRAMTDDKGRMVSEAGPSMPVEVLGFSEVPEAGDTLIAADPNDKLTRQVAEERKDKIKAAQIKKAQQVSLDDLFSQMAEGELKTLNIIVKADVQGSVEAVKQALEKLSNEEVRVKCIHGGVGAITGSDIVFAAASNAIVIGFNVRPDSTARTQAEHDNVDVRTYRVIYAAIEDVQNAMKGMFKPVFKEVELGRISVRETFRISGVGTIAGAYVQEGKVTRNAQVRVVRDGIVLHEGKIASLKRFKDDAREVLTGYECGIGIENFNDLLEGDTIEAFVIEEVKRD